MAQPQTSASVSSREKVKLLKCSCSGVFFFCCLDFGFFEGGEDENCLIRDKILSLHFVRELEGIKEVCVPMCF